MTSKMASFANGEIWCCFLFLLGTTAAFPEDVLLPVLEEFFLVVVPFVVPFVVLFVVLPAEAFDVL